MKLKKIASLMLAGIMAVSMLAACGEGATNDTNPPASSTPTTSSTLVSDAENAVKKLNDTLTISVGQSDKLAEQIDKKVNDPNSTVVSVASLNIDEIVTNVFGNSNCGSRDVYPFFNNAMKGDVSVYTQHVERVNGDKVVMYNVYSNGVITADACRTAAMNQLAECMENVSNSFRANAGEMSNDYTMYVYEGSVKNASNQVIPYVLTVLISETDAV